MKKYLQIVITSTIVLLAGCQATTGVIETSVSYDEDTGLNRTSVAGENTNIYQSKTYNINTGEVNEKLIVPVEALDGVKSDEGQNVLRSIVGSNAIKEAQGK